MIFSFVESAFVRLDTVDIKTVMNIADLLLALFGICDRTRNGRSQCETCCSSGYLVQTMRVSPRNCYQANARSMEPTECLIAGENIAQIQSFVVIEGSLFMSAQN